AATGGSARAAPLSTSTAATPAMPLEANIMPSHHHDSIQGGRSRSAAQTRNAQPALRTEADVRVRRERRRRLVQRADARVEAGGLHAGEGRAAGVDVAGGEGVAGAGGIALQPWREAHADAGDLAVEFLLGNRRGLRV